MTEKKTAKRRQPAKPRPVNAVNFQVWAVNGGPLGEETVVKLEEAFERTIFELFNEGQRLLTQTIKG